MTRLSFCVHEAQTESECLLKELDALRTRLSEAEAENARLKAESEKRLGRGKPCHECGVENRLILEGVWEDRVVYYCANCGGSSTWIPDWGQRDRADAAEAALKEAQKESAYLISRAVSERDEEKRKRESADADVTHWQEVALASESKREEAERALTELSCELENRTRLLEDEAVRIRALVSKISNAGFNGPQAVRQSIWANEALAIPAQEKQEKI